MTITLPNIEQRDTYFNGVKVTSASEKKYGYVWISRAKKSHDWKEVAICWVAGDSCLRAAQIHFEKHGFVEVDYSLGKLVSLREWMSYKVNEHLKSVGIK